MDNDTLPSRLSALSHYARLEVLRLLSREPDGLAAGAIAHRIGISGTNLSAHLAILARAGFLIADRRGRYIVYQFAKGSNEVLLADIEAVFEDAQ